GILIAEKWVDKVIDVQKISERLMMIRKAIGKRVLNLISAYAPHPGRAAKEKEEFWKSVFELLMGISTEESVFVCGDLNGHVGSDPGGYRGVHGGNGYGTRNAEGEVILEFAVAMDLVISNTFFVKEESKTITYESGGCRSAIDFVLVRKREQSMIKDLIVINGEEILPQHKLLICKVEIAESVRRKDDRIIPKTMLWKLKKCDVKEQVQIGSREECSWEG